MRRISYLLFILLISFYSRVTYAQWSIVANNLFKPHSPGWGGVITYKDGIVWAGVTQLFSSPDSGKTWTLINDPQPGAVITEICFLDKDTGAIAYVDFGIYLTYNRGISWTHIIALHECFGLSFARNGKELFVADRDNLQGTVHYTSDGGSTWSQQQVEGNGGGAYDALFNYHNNTAYVLSRSISPIRASHIDISLDFGKTWQHQTGNVDLDCYSFALDSCDSKKIFIGNEELDDISNNLSEIFVSKDNGKTWTSNAQGAPGFFTSSLSAATNAVYEGSSFGQGIFRSTDDGTTWKSIGGPSPREDTRLVCALDDNIIIAADQQGNIWRTLNSGGDSIIRPNGNNLNFSISSKRIIKDSLGVTVYLPIFLKASGVMPSLDITVHYPTVPLFYIKSVLPSGKSVDVPGSSWAGRAKIHFEAADLAARKDSLIGYCVFRWTPYEYDCAPITFDSMQAAISESPCTGKINAKASATNGLIGSFPSCGLAAETDINPPQFQVHKNKITRTDTLIINDGRTTDEGLRSIIWKAEPGTDTTKIIVTPVTPPVLACYDDKINHTLSVVQIDSTAGGCYDFTFTDCLRHKSYDTICFSAHILAGAPENIALPLSLGINHPNPFSRLTTFAYSTIGYGITRLYLYDELGKEAARIVDRMETAGSHSIEFDGSKLPAGSYTARLECAGKVLSRRVMIER